MHIYNSDSNLHLGYDCLETNIHKSSVVFKLGENLCSWKVKLVIMLEFEKCSSRIVYILVCTTLAIKVCFIFTKLKFSSVINLKMFLANSNLRSSPNAKLCRPCEGGHDSAFVLPVGSKDAFLPSTCLQMPEK